MKRHLIVIAAGLLAACTPPASTTSTSSDTAAATETSATAEATDSSGIHVTAPAANARVTSPIIATGDVAANWIFEAQFHAELIGADGQTIVEAPARSEDDWTNGNPRHPFRAELAFTVAADTPATLLLREDMPPDADSDEQRPVREIRIPVTLAAH